DKPGPRLAKSIAPYGTKERNSFGHWLQERSGLSGALSAEMRAPARFVRVLVLVGQAVWFRLPELSHRAPTPAVRLEWLGDSICFPPNAPGGWPGAERLAFLRERSRRDAVFFPAPDSRGQCRTAEASLDFSYGEAGFGIHTRGDRRHYVSDRPGWCVCAGAGNRRTALEARCRADGPARSGVLAG